MIEIRTSNGGRGVGTVTGCTGTHLEFVPRGAYHMMLVPVALVTQIQPALLTDT